MDKKRNFSGAGVNGLVAAALALCWGCGAPTAPSSDSVGHVAGAWLASSTLALANGGECVGSDLRGMVGSRDVFTVAVRQHDTDLEATVASHGNGTICAYSGSVNGAAVTLHLTSCQAGRIGSVRCRDGALRDLQLMDGVITANVNTQLGTGAGKDATSWNVLPSGAATSVGTMTLTADFTWIFLGLPSSDYHVFTGTVFPGYDDGTISIPADPTPFCSRCGWFFP